MVGRVTAGGLLVAQLTLGVGLCATLRPPVPWLVLMGVIGIGVPIAALVFLVATWRSDRAEGSGRALVVEALVVPVSVACILFLAFLSLILIGGLG